MRDGSYTLVLGFVAAVITTGAWVPQAYKTVRSRSARDFSWSSLAMLVVGISLWFSYGVLRGDMAVTLANGVTMVLVLAIVAVKRIYG